MLQIITAPAPFHCKSFRK